MPYLTYFRHTLKLEFAKKYIYISNQHPPMYQNSKFPVKEKSWNLGLKTIA